MVMVEQTIAEDLFIVNAALLQRCLTVHAGAESDAPAMRFQPGKLFL